MAIKRDKVLKDAEKLVQKNKVEQAIREYEKLLKAYPDDTNTINRIGDLYGRIGQVDKAIDLYERIADHFTKDGFATKAIAILKKINRLDPQRLDIFERLAELYVEQGLVVEAKREYQVLADWYIKNEKPEKAVESLNKLVNLEPDNHASALRLADLLMKLQQTEAAVEVYDRLGSMLLEAKKLDEAERLYRHAIEQDPPSGEFLIPACTVFLESGRGPTAREFLDDALRRSPESVALKVLAVRSHLAQGAAKNAIELAQEVLEAEPGNVEIRNLVGAALLSSGETTEARNMLLPVAEGLLDRGDFKGAQEALQDLLKVTPDDQKVLKVAVRAFRPSGDEDTLFTLTAALAESYFNSGEQESAKRLYIKLLESDPENRQFRQRLASLDGADVGELEEHEAEVALPDEVEIDVEDELALVDETPAEAPTPEQEAADEAAFDPAERLAEASVFAKYGLIDKAVHHLGEVVSRYPEHWEARKQLADLLMEQGDRTGAATVAGPLYEHHRVQGTLADLGALLDVMPEEGTAPVATKEVEAAVEFPDDDSDLVEVVDVEGDLVVAAEATAEPEVEEFPIDFDAEVDLFDGTAAAEAEVVTGDRDAASQPTESGVQEAAPDEQAAADEPGEPVAEVRASQEIQVQDSEDLVEVSESFAGPSLQALQQIDFLIQQELYDDAAHQLAALEDEHAEDPEVKSRRLKLKEIGVLLEQVEAVEEGSEELFADEEQYIDLAKELEAELAAEEAMVEEATGRGKGEALLEEVFREFQKGVAEQLSEEDSDTHFNLGIAYREMGLVPEAIREFQVASRDAAFFVESCSMIGVCYKDQGLWTEAADWYQKALVAPGLSDDARTALRYDLAVAHENSGELDQAFELYQEIVATDPSYRDAAQRLDSLSQQRQAN